MFKLAVDHHIGPDLDELADFEFTIVTRARCGEPDDSWVDRGIMAGAEVFVSSDYDIPNYLDQIGASDFPFILMPQSKNKKQQTRFLLHKLRNINKRVK